jgi:hypothetical protein
MLAAEREDPPSSETVMRMLDREAEITTRYGGGFVQSINGLAGAADGARTRDWFFFVNGVESSVGAAEVPVRAGDRIWWDYRDWSEAMRAPAVVGSWPEPFAQAAAGRDEVPATVECATERQSCEEVADRLEASGAEANVTKLPRAGEGEAPRVLVGPWQRLRRDRTAALLEDGPQSSGVFAVPEPSGEGWELDALDRDGDPRALPAGSGLVAALRPAEDPPVWVVTGADRRGVAAAVEMLGEELLRDRYAVAGTPSEPVALPLGATG